MRLSALQRFILLQCYNRMGYRSDRAGLIKFYGNKKIPKRELQTKIITRSIESLIDKELLIGYGVRTPHKWFIREIRLTNVGVKLSRRLLGEQMWMPFFKK